VVSSNPSAEQVATHPFGPLVVLGERQPRVGRVYFADLGETVTYCPECAEREFSQEGAAAD
jgi:hypothetical protein